MLPRTQGTTEQGTWLESPELGDAELAEVRMAVRDQCRHRQPDNLCLNSSFSTCQPLTSSQPLKSFPFSRTNGWNIIRGITKTQCF